MEGRNTAAPTRVIVPTPRQAPWLLASIGSALLLVLALWWWWPRDTGQAVEIAHVPTPATVNPAPPLAAAPAGGAMILDEAGTPANTAPLLADSATPAAAAATTAAATTTTAPEPIATPSTGASIPVAAASGPRERTTAVRAAARPKSPSKKDEENLLGTLLGIIKQPQNAQAKPESMDTLIAQIRADESRNAAANRAAFDSIGSSASTDSGIQAQLRRCSAANTTKGMECRRKICDKMAGKDPACPAR